MFKNGELIGNLIGVQPSNYYEELLDPLVDEA
jgi:hypothetical protein